MSYEYNKYLARHGVKGQKWGVRRYQNEDGTLKNPKSQRLSGKKQNSTEDVQHRKDTVKKLIGIAAGAALTGLAIYGAYKGSGQLKAEYAQQAKNIARSHFKAASAFGKNAKMYRDSASRMEKVDSNYFNKINSAMSFGNSGLKNYGIGKEYRKMAQNATRITATKNWIKNRGKIVIRNPGY